MPRTPLALLTALALAPACMAAPADAPAPPAPPTLPAATTPAPTATPTSPAPLAAPANGSAPADFAKVAAAPAEGALESIEYAGTGCDANSAVTAISPDKQASTSTFSAFVAAADPNIDPGEASKNCVQIVHVNVPAGWSYSFENVIYRGFAGLQRRVSATRKSIYLIAGSPAHITDPATIDGPINDDYQHDDISPEAPGEWSPCGGGQLAWIATQTEVDNHGNHNRTGQITVDSIDTLLRWRRCE